MKNGLVLVVMVSFVLLVGCNEPVAKKAKTASVRLSELKENQRRQRELAIEAKEKLFQSLLGALMSSIQENGVADSISVCKTKAPELAKAASSDVLRIGRTSFQLRNPNNSPPEWAKSFVEDCVKTEVNVELDENRLGVLLPIRLKESCLMCHGSKDSIMPEVATAIRGLYPQDKATGFAAGDLRGYFWVEVANRIE